MQLVLAFTPPTQHCSSPASIRHPACRFFPVLVAVHQFFRFQRRVLLDIPKGRISVPRGPPISISSQIRSVKKGRLYAGAVADLQALHPRGPPDAGAEDVKVWPNHHGATQPAASKNQAVNSAGRKHATDLSLGGRDAANKLGTSLNDQPPFEWWQNVAQYAPAGTRTSTYQHPKMPVWYWRNPLTNQTHKFATRFLSGHTAGHRYWRQHATIKAYFFRYLCFEAERHGLDYVLIPAERPDFDPATYGEQFARPLGERCEIVIVETIDDEVEGKVCAQCDFGPALEDPCVHIGSSISCSRWRS